MAWIRQLDSGLWAATVYTPAGRRTESHRLEGTIAKWARKLEEDIERGEFIDPHLARTTVRQVWEKHGDGRRLERASLKRDTSMMRNHVLPKWGKVGVGAVLKPDVQAWVNKMERDGIGGWTIIGALNVFKAVLELAVDANMIRSNPARRVRPPMAPEHEDRVLTADEEELLLDRFDELFPGRRDGRLFVEALLELGARWEEVAAVKKEAVDLRAGLVTIGPVMERDGTIRDYPKGARTRQAAGFRPVPVGREFLARIKPFVVATKPGGLVFTAATGGALRYDNWHPRVWLAVARVYVRDERGWKVRGDDGKPMWTPLFEDPQPTPHDLRHTYGTRLADAGVEQHDRMALMGHKDPRAAARYVHPGSARHDKARAALAAARGRPFEKLELTGDS